MPQFLRVFPEVDPVTSLGAEFDKGYVPLYLLYFGTRSPVRYTIDNHDAVSSS